MTMPQRSPRAAGVGWWIVWWIGVAIIPVSGIIVVTAAKTCTGFFPVGPLPDHGCMSPVTAIVWGLWLLSFACMVIPLPRFDRVPLRTVVIVQIVAGIAFVLTPTEPTADVYAYHVYGAVGPNWDPWHPTVLVSNREAIVTGLRLWHNPPMPSPYGPVLVWYEHALLAAFPNFTADQLIYVERCISLAVAVFVTLLLRGPRIAMWALHPLVLYEFALAAHCDILMLGLIALAIRLRNPILAGVAIALAGMVKIVGLGAILFRPAAIASAIATVAVVALVDRQFITPKALYGAVYGFNGSPGLVIAVLMKLVFHVQQPDAVVRALVVGAAIVCALTFRVQRRDAAAYAVLLLVAASSWIVPWYLTWPVFAARYAHRVTTIAVSVIAAASMLTEAHAQVHAPATLILGTLAFLTVWALALGWAWRNGPAPRFVFRKPSVAAREAV